MRIDFGTGRFVWVGVGLFAAALLALVGCSGQRRQAQTQQQLLQTRAATDQAFAEESHQMGAKMLQRLKAEYDDYAAGRGKQPPVIDFLIISGGGDWGAFGSGFLKGWGKIPAGDPMAKPEFDGVTGVSTGALIAPFAFLGDEQS